jgi:uncharacterized protein (DUF2384 family)
MDQPGILNRDDVIRSAESIFGTRGKATLWLNEADDRLQGRTPMFLLETEVGRRIIQNMLNQIDEGVYN